MSAKSPSARTRTKRLERRLSAVLCADVAGYSSMMGANEERTHRAVAARLDRLLKAMPRYGGTLMHTAGDGILCEFVSAVNALRFAVFMQQRSAALNATLRAAERIVFRVGINSGDIVVLDDALGGDSINIAARLEQLATPGGICISRAVWEQVHRVLRLDYQSAGETQLKNISSPVEIFHIAPHDASAPALTPTLAPAPPPTAGTADRAALTLPDRPSIAVLPFEDFSPDGSTNFLAEGFADDIITALSKFRELFVIGRNSSFTYRERPPHLADAARELGVQYVLDGSLRRAGETVRIALRLIDGVAGNTVWADTWNSHLDQLLALQDDLLQTIVAQLALRVNRAEFDRARRIETRDLKAYALVLHGQQLLNEATSDGNRRARALYEEALTRDPYYARAVAGISRTHNHDWRYSWVADRAAALERAVVFARKSVDLDGLDPRGHAELGFAYLYRKQVPLAIASYTRALDLNPNDADIMIELADAMVYDGRAEEALPIFHRAMRLNPFYPDWYIDAYTDALSALRRYEETIAAIEAMRDPLQCARKMTASLAHLGRLDEARAHAMRLLERFPNFSISHWAEVPPYRDRTTLEHFMDGLRQAGLPE